MAVSPPKVKAYLATIKELYLDDESSSMTLAERFAGILKIELCLRGIILPNDSKLWGQIQSSVGKNLIEDLPKPLLAGANVMAGRVAESFCRHWKEGTDSDRSAPMIPQEEAAGSLQRAKDIEDERWLILFQGEFHNETAMMQVALGYFTAAALIQSDTPPMWKKVWDTWVSLGDIIMSTEGSTQISSSVPPFEAQVAIENQSRIALSKGNIRRANELQLRLVQSCLNPDRIDLTTISFSAGRKVTLKKTILECFGDTLTGQLESSQVKLAQKAVQALDSCRSFFEEQSNVEEETTSETLIFQALNVQSLIAQEKAQIRAEAEEMYQANQNRSVGKTSSTLEDCVKKCRESLVISSNKDAEIPFENCSFLPSAIKLRDALIQFWGTKNQKDEEEIEMALCFTWVEKSMDRLKDYAHILSRKNGSYYRPWNSVLQFLLPVAQEMQRQCASFSTEGEISPASVEEWLKEELGEGDFKVSSIVLAKLSLISRVTTMLPDIYWMMLGVDNHAPTPADSVMSFVIDLSSELIKIQEGIDKKKKEEADGPSAVGTKILDAGTVRLQTWNHARDTATCFVCQDNDTIISQVTKKAIQSSKRTNIVQPLGFLRCLISWSGWYRHPWPFCSNLTETRQILSVARSDQGRPLTSMEEMLLTMASADAELLNGGFFETAYRQYEELLKKLNSGENSKDDYSLAVLKTHCYNGMARAIQMREDREDERIITDYGKISLNLLDSIEGPPSNVNLVVWFSHQTFVHAKGYQLSVVRQLIAESLMSNGLVEDARSFLEAAVRDSPTDSDAALSYGAFLLRVALFVNKESSPEEVKAAQIQLLKAAKLDPSKADPFALLGVWFEDQGDSQRALRCFKKSLALDPCNAVAGRGLLRLQRRENVEDALDIAIDINSPSNGWAWYAVGLNKAYVESVDELAVVALLKGLRCRDIAHPKSERFGVFLYGSTVEDSKNEEASALADVAKCYRRLGKYTASIRSFHSAIASAGTYVPASVLISCAQVELELGLFDDAANKFLQALEKGDDIVARHGYAESLYSMAQRDFADGKVGKAFASLELAIDCCLKSSAKFACQSKLLGDIYSLGASFPANVFNSTNSRVDLTSNVQRQIEFVSEGEEAYRQCLPLCINVATSEDEEKVLRSCYMCDIATNILLQAQLLSGLESINVDDEVDVMYERASGAFRDAIEENPIFAASWCGFGCSVIRTDPLLAQHAFCRATELDKMSPDPYANLGFLYTSKCALDPSRQTMEVLTQVADTPMMWMNCAYILEREAELCLKDKNDKAEELLGQAADAYRAALQVMKLPSALLGLSMTTRMESSGRPSNDFETDLGLIVAKRKESLSLLKEYRGASSLMESEIESCHAVVMIETANESTATSSWKSEVFEEGRSILRNVLSKDIPGLNKSSLLRIAEIAESETLPSGTATPPDSTRDAEEKELNCPQEWLSRAKELVESGRVDAASEAAGKAAFLFSQKLQKQGFSNSIHAPAVSEAIALDVWLKKLADKTKGMDQDEISLSPSFNLERALLMDPENLLARRGLVG